MNITTIVLGNICSLLAMGTDSLSASRKTVKSMLWIQNISQFIYGISSLLLKGYSATVQNIICILRNLTVIKGIKSKLVAWFLLILGVVVGLLFNNIGFAGLLPIIANLQYGLVVFNFKDNETVIKISFLILTIMFVFFSVAVLNFVGVCTNSIVAITTVVSLIKFRKRK